MQMALVQRPENVSGLVLVQGSGSMQGMMLAPGWWVQWRRQMLGRVRTKMLGKVLTQGPGQIQVVEQMLNPAHRSGQIKVLALMQQKQ